MLTINKIVKRIEGVLPLKKKGTISSAEVITQHPVDEDRRNRVELQKAYLPYGIFPSEFSIMLGYAPCNHKCLFCPQSVVKPKHAHWLDLQILEKVLNELPEQNMRLNISSYTETLVTPNLYEAISLMKKIRPNLPIVMATNGSMLTEAHAEKLCLSGLEELSFSFDAATQETFHTLMQVDHFSKTERNLENLINIRNRLGSKMKILTHIMAFENQREHYEAFKSKWAGKVDVISFRNVGNWGNDNGLDLRERLASKGFIPVYQPPLKRYPCASIFMHFKIGSDGKYYPCVAYTPFQDYSIIDPLALGDAREITFSQAWERLGEMRQRHLAGNWDQEHFCKGCDIWGLWNDMWYETDNGFELDPEITSINAWNEGK